MDTALANCAPTSTACWSAAMWPKAASTATLWKPTACCQRPWWSHRLHEAVATASPPRPRSSACSPTTRARMLRSTTLFARPPARSGRLGHGMMRSWSARITRVARTAARQRHPDRARDGSCSAARLRRNAVARAGWREGTANSHRLDRGPRARHSAVGEIPNARVSPSPATTSSSTAPRARFTSAPRRKSNRPMPSGCGSARGDRRSIRQLRDKPCVTKDGQPVER